MKTVITTILLSVLFLGCSAKEINAGVDSITSDVTNAFEQSRDKSAK